MSIEDISLGDVIEFEGLNNPKYESRSGLFVASKYYLSPLHNFNPDVYDIRGYINLKPIDSIVPNNSNSIPFVMLMDNALHVSSDTFYMEPYIVTYNELIHPVHIGIVADDHFTEIKTILDMFRANNALIKNLEGSGIRHSLAPICFLTGGVYLNGEDYYICFKGYDTNYSTHAILYRILDDGTICNDPIEYDTCFINLYDFPYKYIGYIKAHKMYNLITMVNNNIYPKVSVANLLNNDTTEI